MKQFPGIIEKIHIVKFRKFSNLTIKCGRKLTIIAGQNGTQKTTLLGLIAHPFSMSKRNPDDEEDILISEDEEKTFSEFKTIQGQSFQSKFASKFKFDNGKEKAKEHEYTLYMTNKSIGENGIFTLESMYRDKKNKSLRLWKKGSRQAGDGYMHYPVIYLSLKRVSPIGEEKGIKNTTVQLTSVEQTFLKTNYDEILTLPYEEKYETNELKSSNKSTLISHPMTYSALTVSAGQDNIGSILTAVLSFKRLKEAFPNEYEGGLLFIDEIESTLYPASQENLIKKLFKFARDFQLQIFCTTHSPAVIDIAMKNEYKNDCAFNYLKTTTATTITLDEAVSPEQIHAHLLLKPIPVLPNKKEKIRVYTEDDEARLFLKALLPQKYIRMLNIVKVDMGAEQLIDLKKRRLQEFTNNLIVLDGDKIATSRNIIKLPGLYGPDKLLHVFLKSLPMDSLFWPGVKTTGAYSYQVCFRNYREPHSTEEGEQRKFYKNWFQEQCEHKWWGRNNLRAFKYWIDQNQELVKSFQKEFIKAYNFLARKNKLTEL